MLKFGFRPLGKTLSSLCLGSMNFGDNMDENTSFAVLDTFAEMGGNFIDTARVYGAFGPNGQGASEKVIGRWMKQRGVRKDIVIATKGAHPPLDDMHRGRLDRKSVREDLSKSLDALGIDKIDLYWLHRDDTSLSVEEILQTLNELVQEGKISAFGASNWTLRRLIEADEAAKRLGITGFSANQPMWSLAVNTLIEDDTLIQMDKDMFAWHERSHKACVSYTSQAKGFFSKLEKGGVETLSEKAKKRYYNPVNMATYEEVKRISAAEGLSAGAVALMYMTSQRAFNAWPIIGVSSVDQLKQLKTAGERLLADGYVARLLNLAGLVGGSEHDS